MRIIYIYGQVQFQFHKIKLKKHLFNDNRALNLFPRTLYFVLIDRSTKF